MLTFTFSHSKISTVAQLLLQTADVNRPAWKNHQMWIQMHLHPRASSCHFRWFSMSFFSSGGSCCLTHDKLHVGLGWNRISSELNLVHISESLMSNKTYSFFCSKTKRFNNWSQPVPNCQSRWFSIPNQTHRRWVFWFWASETLGLRANSSLISLTNQLVRFTQGCCDWLPSPGWVDLLGDVDTVHRLTKMCVCVCVRAPPVQSRVVFACSIALCTFKLLSCMFRVFSSANVCCGCLCLFSFSRSFRCFLRCFRGCELKNVVTTWGDRVMMVWLCFWWIVTVRVPTTDASVVQQWKAPTIFTKIKHFCFSLKSRFLFLADL